MFSHGMEVLQMVLTGFKYGVAAIPLHTKKEF